MQIDEARQRQSQLGSVIGDGVDELDLRQEVKFQGYTRTVLPLDGYVFWLPTVEICAHGALHHAQDMLQNEDETFGRADVVFTTREYIAEFSESPVNKIYVATRGDFRYAFSRQQGYFQEAGLWHYQGSSIYPTLATQLVDNPAQIDPTKVIVSNSLPFWLAFNNYATPYIGGFSNPGVTLYPSKLVPANLEPPYGAVHIDPAGTRALQNIPQVQQVTVDGQPTRVMTQLMADHVRLTLYGLTNDQALQFYGSLLEYIGASSLNGLGLINMPAMTDGKRDQVELQAIAMQKLINFDVSYNQYTAQQVALQTIKSATVSWVGFNS